MLDAYVHFLTNICFYYTCKHQFCKEEAPENHMANFFLKGYVFAKLARINSRVTRIKGKFNEAALDAQWLHHTNKTYAPQLKVF